MQYINNKKLRQILKLQDIEEAKQHMETLSDEERSIYITKKSDLWNELRDTMWLFGDFKCWYSEFPINNQPGIVEHFRPKKRLTGLPKGTKHKGYWWRAFDWQNFRIAHSVSNIRVTDYLTGEATGKGSYFPLKDESKRATSKLNEANEIPALIDPCVKDDVKLLGFNTENGAAVAVVQPCHITGKFQNDDDEWNNKRANLTINYYHLDEGKLVTDRKDLIDEITILCDLINKEKLKNDNGIKYNNLINELKGYSEKHKPFLSLVDQIMREKSLLY